MPSAKEAEHVYVLMTDKYRVSRNTRAQWYFNHLNRIVEVEPKVSIVSLSLSISLFCVYAVRSSLFLQEEYNDEIEIVSMLPSDYQDLGGEEATCGPFMITPNTKITFFARRYRLVFILDLSPSMSTVVSSFDLLPCLCNPRRFLIRSPDERETYVNS